MLSSAWWRTPNPSFPRKSKRDPIPPHGPPQLSFRAQRRGSHTGRSPASRSQTGAARSVSAVPSRKSRYTVVRYHRRRSPESEGVTDESTHCADHPFVAHGRRRFLPRRPESRRGSRWADSSYLAHLVIDRSTATAIDGRAVPLLATTTEVVQKLEEIGFNIKSRKNVQASVHTTMSAYAAAHANSKFRWLRAPATTKFPPSHSVATSCATFRNRVYRDTQPSGFGEEAYRKLAGLVVSTLSVRRSASCRTPRTLIRLHAVMALSSPPRSPSGPPS